MDRIHVTTVTATGGREGHIKSADGALDMDIRMPKEGRKEVYANPETLFAGGFAACFDGALNAIMRKAGVKSSAPTTVTAEVSLYKENEGVFLGVVLEVHIPGVDKVQAEELTQQAHQFCPYSKATRNNIDVKLVVK